MIEKPKSIFRDAGFYFGLFCVFYGVIIIGIGFDQFSMFIDIPSLAIVFLTTYGALLIAYGFRPIINAANIAIGKIPADKNDALLAQSLCILGMKLSLLSGILGMLIGDINMLSGGMDNPSVLTSGMAVSMLTNFWGILLCFVFFAAAGRAEKTYIYLCSLPTANGENCEPKKPDKKSFGYILFFIFPMVIVGALLSFFVLLFTMENLKAEKVAERIRANQELPASGAAADNKTGENK